MTKKAAKRNATRYIAGRKVWHGYATLRTWKGDLWERVVIPPAVRKVLVQRGLYEGSVNQAYRPDMVALNGVCRCFPRTPKAQIRGAAKDLDLKIKK